MSIWMGGSLLPEIATLEALTSDLKRIVNGSAPTADELESAPALLAWTIQSRRQPCLEGYVVDHPRLKPGLVTTSELWAVDPQQKWARTFSRFYRLSDLQVLQ